MIRGVRGIVPLACIAAINLQFGYAQAQPADAAAPSEGSAPAESTEGEASAPTEVAAEAKTEDAAKDEGDQGVSDAVATATEAVPEMDEVVLTAYKRKQRQQDVSAPVSVVSGKRLEGGRINSIEELQAIVPNISLGQDFNTAKLSIRGVGTNTSTSGSDPGVALHVDGAIIARPENQLTSMFDLERVEVLRGPQGTLYGRNAVGGSINLITAKPTEQTEGYVRLIAGNYNAYGVSAAVSGPITDSLLYRVAIQADERGGYGTNPETGNDINNLSRQMGRVHLQFKPSEDFDTLFTVEGIFQDDRSSSLMFRAPSFPDTVGLEPTGDGGYADNPRDLASETDPVHKLHSISATSTTNWNLTEEISLTNIVNYRDYEGQMVQDLDLSGVLNSIDTTGRPTTIMNRTLYSRQLSEELQFKYADDRLSAVAGVYVFREEFGAGPNTVGLTPTGGQPQVAAALDAQGITADDVFRLCRLEGLIGSGQTPPRYCGLSDHVAEAYAGFGQAVFRVVPSFALKAGARYSFEQRSEVNPGFIVVGGGRGPAVIRFTRDDVGDNGGAPETGVSLGTRDEADFSSFTPEAGFEWRPTDDVLAYYTYSEGFKSGTGEVTITNSEIIEPERIFNHEVGVKTSWPSMRLVANVALFHYDLEGLQVNRTFSDPAAGFRTALQNAAATSANGVELEVRWLPLTQLRFNGSIAYQQSRFDDFETADSLDPSNITIAPATAPADPQLIQLAGNPTRNSPDLVAAMHVEYDFPVLPNNAIITLSTDVLYKDKQYFSEFARDIEGAKAYGWVDANLSYLDSEHRIHGSLWVKNAADVLRASGTFAVSTARQIGVSYMQPRTFGATLGYNFY